MWIGNVFTNCSVRATGFLSASPASCGKPTFLSTKIAPVFVRQLSVTSRFSTIKKLFPNVAVSRPVLLRYFRPSKNLRSDVINTNVAKDVILYKFENRRLFRIATAFAILNSAVLLSVSVNLYTITSLEWEKQNKADSSTEFEQEPSTSPPPEVFNPRDHLGIYSFLDVGSNNLRLALAGICFVLAYAVLGAVYMYCNNSVRYVVLRKGGKQVTLVTHGFFAMNRYGTHEVQKMSCRGNRTVSSAILLRAQDRYFSYILDKDGEFTNPQLFDATVGVLRDIRK